MTRDEIRERAGAIGIDLAAVPRSAYARVDAVIERHLLSIVRATLEEAARAVCRGCCEMDYNPLTMDHRQQMNDAGDFVGGPCLAIGIHDLIAALEGKGE